MWNGVEADDVGFQAEGGRPGAGKAARHLML